jgi:hypothetical protein
MQFKTAVLWWLVNDQKHPALTKDDMQIKALKPLLQAMFPGINYYSLSGFIMVQHRLVVPVLKKQHPGLETMSAAQVKPNSLLEVSEVMPSRGYQWEGDPAWKLQFDVYLTS